MLLLTAGVTAFSFAVVLGEVLIVVFRVSPRSLHAAASYGPGSEAIVAAMKVPFGPGPTPARGSGIDDVIAQAAESLAGELKWIWSPWRIVINNGMATLVAWILIPWLGIALSSRSTFWKTERQRRQYLAVCLLGGPCLFLCAQEFRLGLWTVTGVFIQGPSLVSLLPHGIPEMTACFISALIPVHYYLRHVRGESPVRYSAYSTRHLGSYALVASLLVLAAFIEAGRLKFAFSG